jgi:GH24 family phage-related lysozyme (muramidase)
MSTKILAFLLLLTLPAAAQTSEQFRSYIVKWEGYRNIPYLRAGGERSVGIGHNTAGDEWKTRYSDLDIERAYLHDYAKALDTCRTEIDGFDNLPLEARFVALSLCWTVGRRGLGKFHSFRKHLGARQYYEASDDLLDSKWIRQVSVERWYDHVERLRVLAK